MTKVKDDILKFMSTRPEVNAIIGYGSGINPQKGQEKRKPQIDLIVVVDDLKKWHLDNIKMNPSDYSFSAKNYFRLASEKNMKSGGKICYMTYIPFEGNEYKIGTIQREDFENDLDNWETFYMAGRMQKPILIVKADKELEAKIKKNRQYAVNVCDIVSDTDSIDERDYYINLAGLSYIGDTRMGIAENPDKVKNIVDGRFDFYEVNYGSLCSIKDGKVIISNCDDKELPLCLKEYISSHKNMNLKDATIAFLTEKNKSQSVSQTIKGFFTTGPVKAIKYAREKLKRRKRK